MRSNKYCAPFHAKNWFASSKPTLELNNIYICIWNLKYITLCISTCVCMYQEHSLMNWFWVFHLKIRLKTPGCGEGIKCARDFTTVVKKSWWNILLRMDIQCTHWTTDLTAERKWWKIQILQQTDILQRPSTFSVGTARCQELEDDFYAPGHFRSAPYCL